MKQKFRISIDDNFILQEEMYLLDRQNSERQTSHINDDVHWL
jgi:hypothetical protein